MEEDEDRILLSSLGVTSANPEDIERGILSEVCEIKSKFELHCFDSFDQNHDFKLISDKR